jgi:hypothetical protein
LQFVNRLQNPAPDYGAIHVATFEQFVCPPGRSHRGIFPVLVNQQLRGAGYVGVVDQTAVCSASPNSPR